MPFNINSSKPTSGELDFEISLNSKEGGFYFSFYQSVLSDNPLKKLFTIKFNREEAGTLLDSIRTKSESSFVHQSFSEGTAFKTCIKFLFFNKNDRTGYGFLIKRDDKTYKSAFSIGSGRLLEEYLVFGLDRIFNAIYSSDKKAAKNLKNEDNKENSEDSP